MFLIKQATFSVRKKERACCFFATHSLDNSGYRFYLDFKMEISALIKELRDILLDSEIRDSIAKVVLFGSYAKGTASEDSDIDVLVLTTENGKTEQLLMEKIYDFILGYDVPLEVLIANIDSLYLDRDYFTYNVLRYGQEIYSMDTNNIKTSMLGKLMDLAEEYLDSAQEVFENKRIRLTFSCSPGVTSNWTET